MTLFKKILTGSLSALMLICINSNDACAQSHKTERRIYLWDVSISMVGATKHGGCEPPRDRKNPSYKYDEGYKYYNSEGDIFVRTRDVLIKSIRSIRDEKCEIVVIPYVETMQSPMVAKCAKSEEKERLIEQIMSWDNLKKGGNQGGTCLKQVIDTYEDGKFNRVILLTDGHDYSEEELKNIIEEWEVEGDGKYRDDRLIFALLSPTALEKNKEIIATIDKKNSDNKDHGVIYLKDLNDLQEYVNFSLGSYDSEVVIEDNTPETMILKVPCRLSMGYMEAVKCVFSTDSELVSVDTDLPIVPEGGQFRIPLRFKMNSRIDYLNAIRNSGRKFLEVKIRCSVDSSCKSVTLEGPDVIKLDICVDPQPKAIVTISRN